MSAEAIQGSAGVMMRHYDKSPTVAVTEWRNTLQNANSQQFLPLLYVANEVLQTSKRNRGTKFLEAFSPVLGQALQYICQCDPSLTEKVRRTTKIWGDRRVFSVRFVNDLLKILEPYRHGNALPPKKEPMAAPFSPVRDEPEDEDEKPTQSQQPQQQQQDTTPEESQPDDDHNDDDHDGNSIDDIMADTNNNSLGFAEDGMHLDLDLKIDSSVLGGTTKKQPRASSKRGRDDGTVKNTSSAKASRRRSVLSTTSLMELWNQTSALQQSFEQSRAVLSATVTPEHLNTDESSTMDLVGDELLANFKDCLKAQSTIATQRHVLHRIANDRRRLEQECVRYIPWFRLSRKQDDEDAKLCDELEKKLLHLKMIHAQAKKSRDIRREKYALQQRKAAAEEKIRQEEEERRRLILEATKKETEEKPGMVWNSATREYQYLNTDESWRD
eukprot:CAMPEP_0195281208 /NCGR_PEP_ID=MMETSP0707-20130614/620_1 /TAXON_ID=33640 /ORGANISM="Asterionellopsis glacialis, Strain CCMP134" /LENGTH=441 /DNA_ID=CAMNT_0040340075 /DNA_START=2085 /DNA_END=3410 /DNA_ORIENTATION=-